MPNPEILMIERKTMLFEVPKQSIKRGKKEMLQHGVTPLFI